MTDIYGKRLWIDIKGRQLRIEKWADPTYGDIELNHEISVPTPATIYFRGDESSTVVGVKGNKVYVDPPPPNALGAGQAINIISPELKIHGEYLTELDKEFIREGRKIGVNRVLLSFVEKNSDITDVTDINPDMHAIGLKIESIKGLKFVYQDYEKTDKTFLVWARDDMMINIGRNKANIIKEQKKIIYHDKDTVAASHLFTSLKYGQTPSVSDFADLRLLQLMGYRNFLLSDGISHEYFDEAMRHWAAYNEVFGDET